MPDRLRIYIPTEAMKAGDAVVLYGPGAGGGVDLATPIDRTIAVPFGDGGHFERGRGNGPDELHLSGMETRAAVMLTPPMGPGKKEFAAAVLDRETQAAAVGSLATFSMFVNAAPRGASNVRVIEQLVGGRMRFEFDGSEDLG